MGEIVGAGLVAHVPTIMLPEEFAGSSTTGRRSASSPGCSACGRRCSTG